MKLSFTLKIRYNDTVNNFYFKWNKEVHAQLRAFSNEDPRVSGRINKSNLLM